MREQPHARMQLCGDQPMRRARRLPSTSAGRERMRGHSQRAVVGARLAPAAAHAVLARARAIRLVIRLCDRPRMVRTWSSGLRLSSRVRWARKCSALAYASIAEALVKSALANTAVAGPRAGVLTARAPSAGRRQRACDASACCEQPQPVIGARDQRAGGRARRVTSRGITTSVRRKRRPRRDRGRDASLRARRWTRVLHMERADDNDSPLSTITRM
jgi:hypothetical protein